MTRLYLDANASEPLRPAARDAVAQALELTGNPSSIHGAGRAARSLLEGARQQVASFFGVRSADVVFTSGATEANALAIHGLVADRRLLVGATEHPAILRCGRSFGVLPVQPDGQVDLAELERQLAEDGHALVSLMAANNETGVLHPIKDAAALCRRYGAILHVDAVQAVGRIPLDLFASGADSVVISGHKMGGGKGAGALLLRPGLDPVALLTGGGQERGRRGGTEPLPAISGLAAALRSLDPTAYDRVKMIRDQIEVGSAGNVIGQTSPRLPNTCCIATAGVKAETQVIALDLKGVEVSSGSACSSGKVASSPVLTAMGLQQEAGCAIRVSLPWNAPDDAAGIFLAAHRAILAQSSMRHEPASS